MDEAQSAQWDEVERDAALERSLRVWAIPVALLGSFVLVHTGLGRALVRIFFSMWVHEIGHAAAAWLCGYLAFPGPWLTPIAAERSVPFAVLVSSALAFAAVRTWTSERRGLGTALASILAVQLACTMFLRPASARQFIVFAGDGGCLVFGTLLMSTLYARAGGAIRAGWLRWGLLAIGSASFADVFALWWSARHDEDVIPFGHNEGSGLSDPSVLSETFGWSTNAIVHRYVVLGCVCLVALAVVYGFGLLRSDEDAS
jgi:hypothetical protein